MFHFLDFWRACEQCPTRSLFPWFHRCFFFFVWCAVFCVFFVFVLCLIVSDIVCADASAFLLLFSDRPYDHRRCCRRRCWDPAFTCRALWLLHFSFDLFSPFYGFGVSIPTLVLLMVEALHFSPYSDRDLPASRFFDLFLPRKTCRETYFPSGKLFSAANLYLLHSPPTRVPFAFFSVLEKSFF